MEAFLPDENLRKRWFDKARAERQGERANFWKNLPELPSRPNDAHKGTFGKALAIGGSRGMSGAIALAGSACLFAGAGLTRLATPNAILDTVAGFQREYTTIPLPNDQYGRIVATYETLSALSADADALAIGPGLARPQKNIEDIARLYHTYPRAMVVDADALNILASFSDSKRRVGLFAGPRVLTPHPGEFARLSELKPGSDQKSRIDAVQTYLKSVLEESKEPFSEELVVALKGHETIVARIEKESNEIEIWINKTGNANLATGGSGDVLTGTILGLLAQRMNAYDATRAGVALHGVAAELRATICSRGAIASDAARFLPAAIDFYLSAKEQ